VRGAIRVPTVIVAVNYAKVPKKRPKLGAKTIGERDANRCQYTGQLLKPEEGSLDHVAFAQTNHSLNPSSSLKHAGQIVARPRPPIAS